jgi:hypothetical protein
MVWGTSVYGVVSTLTPEHDSSPPLYLGERVNAALATNPSRGALGP